MDYGHFRVYSKALSIWFWKFALDPVVVIFFKNAKQITSGGLILSLAKFGLIPYINLLQKIFTSVGSSEFQKKLQQLDQVQTF